MRKSEGEGQYRGSIAKGVGRILVVLAALYWFSGAFAVLETYQSAYHNIESTAQDGANNVASEAAPNAGAGASIAGATKSHEPAAASPLAMESRKATLRKRYRQHELGNDNATYEEVVKRGLLDDPYALDIIARRDGLNAASWALLGWIIGFATLALTIFVVRWVLLGFFGKPD